MTLEAKGRFVREGWTLVMTCPACPEQYNLVDHNGDMKAYLRLRWGYFRVACPDFMGETVFEHQFDEELKGAFDQEEVDEFLTKAVDAADAWWRAKQEGLPRPCQ